MSKPTIKLDSKGQRPKTGVVFDLEHAKELLRLEQSMGVENWVISSGEPYTTKDGEIIPTASTGVAKSKPE